ncbi:FMN reductase [Streptomyces sp. NA04227]|uniref:FMN reductase n=1 Tax=Streptomyces sp. NA04227 TaxID=2742136 RepID=UPI001590EE0C|nr:FMN reductase [Streptomyces sp. NA04227]QKW08397.1 FMN reductase [Streptomyces sp. NA04227]
MTTPTHGGIAATRIVVVSAGLGSPSSTRLLGDRLAGAVVEHGQRAAGRGEFTVEVIELRDLAVEIAHNLLTGFPGPKLAAAVESVTGADGLIAVTPVFSASYSGLFKSFFDVLDPESLTGKPVLIAATGGTPRHSLVLEHAMRPLFAHLRTVVAPTAVYAASQDWGADGLEERIDRAGRELASLTALSGAEPGQRERGAAAATGVVATEAGAPSDGARPSGAAPDGDVPDIPEPVPPAPGPEQAFLGEVVPFAEQLAALRAG